MSLEGLKKNKYTLWSGCKFIKIYPPPPRKVAAPLQYMHQARGSDPEMNAQHTCHSFCVAIQFGVLARRCPCFVLWCRLGCLGRHHDDVGWPLVPI